MPSTLMPRPASHSTGALASSTIHFTEYPPRQSARPESSMPDHPAIPTHSASRPGGTKSTMSYHRVVKMVRLAPPLLPMCLSSTRQNPRMLAHTPLAHLAMAASTTVYMRYHSAARCCLCAKTIEGKGGRGEGSRSRDAFGGDRLSVLSKVALVPAALAMMHLFLSL